MDRWRVITCILSLCALCALLSAQEMRVSVTNPSPLSRPDEPVIVSWADVARRVPKAASSHLHLTDEEGGQIVFQVDDLDFDGAPDELVFLADFNPRQRRTFLLKFVSREETVSPAYAPRTDAQNYKRISGVLQSLDDDEGPGLKRDQTLYRFDGVGWESELVGYRLYLDERNAVDIHGKRKRALQWKFMGTTDVDYQQDSDWGMDILHVGPALGVGGIGFWVADSVLKPHTLERRRCRIVARGPVRAVVRIDYAGWEVGGEKVDLTSFFTICAGDRVSEHRVILRKGQLPKTLVTGIVKHPSGNTIWDPKEGSLSTLGAQSRVNDQLLMALNVVSSSVVKRTEDEYNQLLLLTIELNKPLTFLISSRWQGETGQAWSDVEVREFLQRTSARLNEPLQVQLQ